ncbi:MAG: hypothetical protein AAGK14_01010 [Verrucomicrobiota bacterium]
MAFRTVTSVVRPVTFPWRRSAPAPRLVNRREVAERLTEDLGIVFFALGPDDRLCFHNRAWQEFFERNGTGRSTGRIGLGDPMDRAALLSSLGGEDGLVLGRDGWAESYREAVLPCHAPNQRRWMLERVQPLGDELVVSFYFLRAYSPDKPLRPRVSCLFTGASYESGWSSRAATGRSESTLGLSPECSLLVYQWLREGRLATG